MSHSNPKSYSSTWNKNQVNVKLNQSQNGNPFVPEEVRNFSNNNLNRTFSRDRSAPRPKANRYMVEEPDYANSKTEEFDPLKTIYDLQNEISFKDQVEDLEIDSSLKSAFINAHKKMLSNTNELKNTIDIVTKNNAILSSDLASKNRDFDNTVTQFKATQDELAQLQIEVDKRKMLEEEAEKLRQECEVRMTEYQNKYYAVEKEMIEIKKTNKFLQTSVSTLEVENKTKDRQVNQMDCQIEILEKSLSIHDSTLAKKTQIYDNKFSYFEKQTEMVQNLANSTKDLYSSISEKNAVQAEWLSNFNSTANRIANNLANVDNGVTDLTTGPFKEIREDLQQIRRILVEEISQEVKMVQTNRTGLAKEHSKMTEEYEEVKNSLKSYYKGLSIELNKLKVSRFEYLQEFIPIFVVIDSYYLV